LGPPVHWDQEQEKESEFCTLFHDWSDGEGIDRQADMQGPGQLSVDVTTGKCISQKAGDERDEHSSDGLQATLGEGEEIEHLNEQCREDDDDFLSLRRRTISLFNSANKSVLCSLKLSQRIDIGPLDCLATGDGLVGIQEIQASILSDMARRKQKGERLLATPEQYAELLGISDTDAWVILEHLAQERLIRVEMLKNTGMLRIMFINDITSRGMDFIKARHS
jgi:hypothetical protein